jgi:hypothetical protein
MLDVTRTRDYIFQEVEDVMTLGFKNRRVKRLYGGEDVKEWSDIRRRAEKQPRILGAADRLESLAALPRTGLRRCAVIAWANTALT